MGEPEAYKALEEGYIRVDGKVYNMESSLRDGVMAAVSITWKFVHP